MRLVRVRVALIRGGIRYEHARARLKETGVFVKMLFKQHNFGGARVGDGCALLRVSLETPRDAVTFLPQIAMHFVFVCKRRHTHTHTHKKYAKVSRLAGRAGAISVPAAPAPWRCDGAERGVPKLDNDDAKFCE